MLAYLATDLEAVKPGKHDIEYHEVIVRAERLIESALSVKFYLNRIAVRLEIIALEFGYIFSSSTTRIFLLIFRSSYFACGKSIITLSPPSSLSSARMDAPWRSVICFVIARPRPLPFL